MALIVLACLATSGCVSPTLIIAAAAGFLAFVSLVMSFVIKLVGLIVDTSVLTAITTYLTVLGTLILANCYLRYTRSDGTGVYGVAILQAAASAVVVVGAMCFVHWPSVPGAELLAYWGGFIFLATLILHTGEMTVLNDQKTLAVAVRSAVDRDIHEPDLRRSIQSEIEWLHVSSWWTYGPMIIAPFLAGGLAVGGIIRRTATLEISVVIACAGACAAIVVVVGRAALQLWSPLRIDAADDITWPQWKALYAVTHDIRSVQAFESLHDLLIGTAYAVGGIATVLGIWPSHRLVGILSLFCVASVSVSAVLVFVPFALGRHRLMNSIRTKVLRSPDVSYLDWDVREAELLGLRPVAPVVPLWKYLVPAIATSGLLSTVFAKLLEVGLR